MMKQQLEMTFDQSVEFRPKIRQRKQSRARWWFEQMRQIVDRAVEQHTVPPAPPEQIYFPLGGRIGRGRTLTTGR